MLARRSTQVLTAAAALVLFAGCSSMSAFAPKPSTPQNAERSLTGGHIASFNSCPDSSAIVYISDDNNNVINIYTAPFAGQSPCGSLTGLDIPEGLFVDTNHDLYVANFLGDDILVFRRGSTSYYNTYFDNLYNYVMDVTKAPDGTVIAANFQNQNSGFTGSLSTWLSGPKGGTFVGNFLNAQYVDSYFVAAQQNGTVYFNTQSAIYTTRCPLGKCSAFRSTGASLSNPPGGLRSDNGDGLVAVDQGLSQLNTYKTYSTSPEPISRCSIGSYPIGIDFDESQHNIFVADSGSNEGIEYTYPGCALVGTVPGSSRGRPVGVAYDYAVSRK
jgi:hypothetical protein